MSHLMRILKTPDCVICWHVWEAAGEAMEVIIRPGEQRTFCLQSGTLRAMSGGSQDGDPAVFRQFENNIRDRPDFLANGFVEIVAPAIYPMSTGHWITEAVGGPAAGWCLIALEEAKLDAIFGTGMGARILGGDWDGDFFVHADVVLNGTVDNRQAPLLSGHRTIDSQFLASVAHQDLRQILDDPQGGG